LIEHHGDVGGNNNAIAVLWYAVQVPGGSVFPQAARSGSNGTCKSADSCEKYDQGSVNVFHRVNSFEVIYAIYISSCVPKCSGTAKKAIR
jgi:hypothetical protein